MKTLKKVAESAVKQDKNAKNYKSVTFSTPQKNAQGIYLKPKMSALNLFEKSYLNQQEEFGYSLPLNAEVQGNIETRSVEPYTFTGADNVERTVNTFTCIVLGDSDSPVWETEVQREMLRKGHKVVNTVTSTVQAPLALATLA